MDFLMMLLAVILGNALTAYMWVSALVEVEKRKEPTEDDSTTKR